MSVILKSPGEIEAMKAAGQLSTEVLRKVGELVKPGVSTLELDEFSPKPISASMAVFRHSRGMVDFRGRSAHRSTSKSFMAFPRKKLCFETAISLVLTPVQLLMVGLAITPGRLRLGRSPSKNESFLKVTEECMWAGLDCAVAGNHLGDIGHAVQSIAENAGFGVVREYVGHGVGRNMHEEPNVPNYGHRHFGMKLQVGMVLAIEPMINMGTRKVLQGKDGWLVSTRDGMPSAHFEKMVAITEDGPVILTTEPDHRRPL